MDRDSARELALSHARSQRPDLEPTGQIAMATVYESYLMGELDTKSLELKLAAAVNLDPTQVRAQMPVPTFSYTHQEPLKPARVYSGDIELEPGGYHGGNQDLGDADDYPYANGPVMPPGKAEVRS